MKQHIYNIHVCFNQYDYKLVRLEDVYATKKKNISTLALVKHEEGKSYSKPNKSWYLAEYYTLCS